MHNFTLFALPLCIAPAPISDHFVMHEGWSLTRELTVLYEAKYIKISHNQAITAVLPGILGREVFKGTAVCFDSSYFGLACFVFVSAVFGVSRYTFQTLVLLLKCWQVPQR